MSVRAKFKIQRIEKSWYTRQKPGHKEYKPEDMEQVELRTIIMSPVYGNGDPNHENTKFWSATPIGELKLATLSPQAWAYFEEGPAEYYIDIERAPAEQDSAVK